MLDSKTSKTIFDDFLAGKDFYSLLEQHKTNYDLIEAVIRHKLLKSNYITPLVGLEILIDFVKGKTVNSLAEKYNINSCGIQKIIRDSVNDMRLDNITFINFTVEESIEN